MEEKVFHRPPKKWQVLFGVVLCIKSKVDQQPFLSIDVSVNAGLDADCDYPFPNKAMLEVLT